MMPLMTDLVTAEPLRSGALAGLILGALLGAQLAAARILLRQPVPVRVRRR